MWAKRPCSGWPSPEHMRGCPHRNRGRGSHVICGAIPVQERPPELCSRQRAPASDKTRHQATTNAETRPAWPGWGGWDPKSGCLALGRGKFGVWCARGWGDTAGAGRAQGVEKGGGPQRLSARGQPLICPSGCGAALSLSPESRGLRASESCPFHALRLRRDWLARCLASRESRMRRAARRSLRCRWVTASSVPAVPPSVSRTSVRHANRVVGWCGASWRCL